MELLKTHTDFKTCLIPSVELAELARLWDLSGSGAESLWMCSAPETPAADTLVLRLGSCSRAVPQQGSLDLCEELTLRQRRRTGRPVNLAKIAQVGKEWVDGTQ